MPRRPVPPYMAGEYYSTDELCAMYASDSDDEDRRERERQRQRAEAYRQQVLEQQRAAQQRELAAQQARFGLFPAAPSASPVKPSEPVSASVTQQVQPAAPSHEPTANPGIGFKKN